MLSNYLSNSFLYQVYQRDLFQRKKGKRILDGKSFPPPIVNFRIHFSHRISRGRNKVQEEEEEEGDFS